MEENFIGESRLTEQRSIKGRDRNDKKNKYAGFKHVDYVHNRRMGKNCGKDKNFDFFHWKLQGAKKEKVKGRAKRGIATGVKKRNRRGDVRSERYVGKK